MRNLWNLIIAALFVVTLLTARIYAQSSGESAYLINATSPTLNRLHQSGLVYEGEGDRLQYAPIFVIETLKNGCPNTEIVSPLTENGPWELQIHILVNPECLVQEMANQVRVWTNGLSAGSPFKRYENVTRQHLLPVEMTSLHVSQITSPNQKPLFQPYQIEECQVPKRVTVSAYFESEREAVEFQKKLNGKSRVRFKIECSFKARHVATKSTVNLTANVINKSEAIQSVNGAGRPFTGHVVPENREISLGQDALVLTRTQMTNLVAELTNDVRETYRIEDPSHLSLLRSRLEEHLKTVFEERFIGIDDVGSTMKYLSSYGFDPADLSPDKIQKIAYEQRDLFQSKHADAHQTSVSARASFLGIGGSGAVNHSGQTQRERMEDSGWRFGLSGEVFVPKGITVFVAVNKQIRVINDIAIEVNVGSRGETLSRIEVSSDNGITAGQIVRNEKPLKRIGFGEPRRLELTKRPDGKFQFIGVAETDGFVQVYCGGDGSVGEITVTADGTGGYGRGRSVGGPYDSFNAIFRAGEKFAVVSNGLAKDAVVMWFPLELIER